MKKICILSMITLLLVGCNNSISNSYNQEDLGIYDVKSQQIITLGCTRETIEKYICYAENEASSHTGTTYCGYGANVYSSANIDDARELEIEYDVNNTAIGFTLNSCWNKEDSRFSLPTGVGVLSKVNEFQDKYPNYTENKNGHSYSSEIHLKKDNKKDNNVFKCDNFTENDYLKFKQEYTDEAITNDENIGMSIEKSRDLLLHIDNQWAYIIAEYYNYAEIETIKIGYGWN